MRLLLLFIALFSFSFLFSQEKEEEKETVQVRKKIEFSIYKGVLQETKDWYIVVDSDSKYYLINVLQTTIDTDKPFVYTLELMDHNVSMVYLDETQSIVIQKDGYKIEESRQQQEEVEDNVEVVEDKTEVVEDNVEIVEESSIFKDVEIVEKEKLE
jgi:hypothetical protein